MLQRKNFKVVLLNCISSYPAKNNELNISYINNLKKYSKLVGYSDHSNLTQQAYYHYPMVQKLLKNILY